LNYLLIPQTQAGTLCCIDKLNEANNGSHVQTTACGRHYHS
jgi:hypothetical protein